MQVKLFFILLIFILPLQSVLGQTNTTTSIDKLRLIETVMIDAKDNCNSNPKTSSSFNPDIQKFDEMLEEITKPGREQAEDNCKKGMAWLKIECDLNYNVSQICRENMPVIKGFLAERHMDERDAGYFHDEYNQVIDAYLNTTTYKIEHPTIDISTTEMSALENQIEETIRNLDG
jgi:hypothetical protein